MKKAFILIFAMVQLSLAQSDYSIQAMLGAIYPRSSDNGYTAGVSINKKMNGLFTPYLSFGYSTWNKYNISYLLEITETNKNGVYSTYSSDQHTLLSVIIGTKIIFREKGPLTSYFLTEIAGSGFSYNSYQHIPIYSKYDNKIIGYEVDLSSQKKENKYLFGIGFGIGTIYHIYKNVGILIEGKIASNFNNDDISFFRARGTNWQLLSGINLEL